MLTTIVGQLSKGYFNLEIGLYLRGLFVVSLSWWLIVAALMLAVQTFVNNKIVGFAILFIYYILIDVLPSLGWDHHLFIYGTAPDVLYSDMNGYSFYGLRPSSGSGCTGGWRPRRFCSRRFSSGGAAPTCGAGSGSPRRRGGSRPRAGGRSRCASRASSRRAGGSTTTRTS